VVGAACVGGLDVGRRQVVLGAVLAVPLGVVVLGGADGQVGAQVGDQVLDRVSDEPFGVA
jgi:hypothetical protein